MENYIKTVRALLKASGKKDAFEVFKTKNVKSYICNHNDWNGGIDYYKIEVSIPASLYAKLRDENEINPIAECIKLNFDEVIKGHDEIIIQEVLLIPIDDSGEYESESIADIDDSNIWKANYYKLFISHLTENKDSASNLKNALLKFGIAGFVAHEDIEPTKEWQSEIETALYTMDALCAIFVPDFIKSKWCDQELGFAMGMKKIIIPIRKGADPYGFAGKIQGVQGHSKSATGVAESIFKVLCKNEKSKNPFMKVIANLFLNSKDNDESMKWIHLLSSIEKMDLSVINYIHSNYQNNEILNNKTVIREVNKLFCKYSMPAIVMRELSENVSSDDDLPF